MDLRELLKRVENATGPDRALDADICVALGYMPGVPDATNLRHSTPAAYDLDGAQPWVTYVRPPHLTGFSEAPALTASIDAAVALVERMLPGAMLDITIHKTAQAFVRIEDHDAGACWSAPNPAIAIVTATVEAMVAQDPAQ